MSLKLKRSPLYAPRAPRRAVSCSAVAWLGDDRHVPIMITNLSRAGFTATVDVTPPPARTEFGVELPGMGIVRAEVRWVGEGEFGSRFEQMLSDTQFTAC